MVEIDIITLQIMAKLLLNNLHSVTLFMPWYTQKQLGPSLKYLLIYTINFGLKIYMNFPGISDGKESTCSAGGLGSTPGSGKSPGEQNVYPLQYSCQGGPMDRGAWWVTVHGLQTVICNE